VAREGRRILVLQGLARRHAKRPARLLPRLAVDGGEGTSPVRQGLDASCRFPRMTELVARAFSGGTHRPSGHYWQQAGQEFCQRSSYAGRLSDPAFPASPIRTAGYDVSEDVLVFKRSSGEFDAEACHHFPRFDPRGDECRREFLDGRTGGVGASRIAPWCLGLLRRLPVRSSRGSPGPAPAGERESVRWSLDRLRRRSLLGRWLWSSDDLWWAHHGSERSRRTCHSRRRGQNSGQHQRYDGRQRGIHHIAVRIGHLYSIRRLFEFMECHKVLTCTASVTSRRVLHEPRRPRRATGIGSASTVFSTRPSGVRKFGSRS
jgi:hypothetical protein